MAVANAAVRREVETRARALVDGLVDLAEMFGADWVVPLVRDRLGDDVAGFLHDRLVDRGWVYTHATDSWAGAVA